jgi:hypothetical protein
MKSTPDTQGPDGAATPTRSTLPGRKFKGRAGLIVLGLLALAAVIWHWERLVALGIAPLILVLAPCLLMCGLGLCMKRLTGRSCTSRDRQPTPSDSADPDIGQKMPIASSGDPAAPGGPADLEPARLAEDNPTRTNGKPQE